MEAFRGLPLFCSVEETVVMDDTSLGRHHKKEDQNWKSLVEFNLEQRATKGDMTAAVKHLQSCCEGVVSLFSVSKGWGQEGRASGAALRFSLDIKKHFPWAERVQCWDRLPGGVVKAFSCVLAKHQSKKYRWLCPGAEEWTRWLLDVLSNLVFLCLHGVLQNRLVFCVYLNRNLLYPSLTVHSAVLLWER